MSWGSLTGRARHGVGARIIGWTAGALVARVLSSYGQYRRSMAGQWGIMSVAEASELLWLDSVANTRMVDVGLPTTSWGNLRR